MNRLNQTSLLKQLLVILLPIFIFFIVSIQASYASTIITVAGAWNQFSQYMVLAGIEVWTDTYNGDGIPATSAYLKHPIHAALDSHGNLYISDRYNNRIRKVDTMGTISTVAGGGDNGDGVVATSAKLHRPQGVTLDNNGNLYIGDTNSHRVCKVDATTGIITIVVGTGTEGFSGDGGPPTSAELDFPTGIVLDSNGNLYIVEPGNDRVRKVLPIDPPVAPTDLKAVASSTQIDLSWKDNSDNETGFKVTRCAFGICSGYSDVGMITTTTEANTTSYSHTDLTCSSQFLPDTYAYRVKATNEAGDSTEVTVTAATLACPPSRPLKLVAKVVSETQIDLTWYDLSTNETGYLIERSNNDNLTWAIIAQTKANSTTYSDTGLTCGTTYYYHHHAINDGGQSLPSVDVNATTEACSTPPLAPTNLTAG